MADQSTIVVATIPEVVDFDKIEDRVRNQHVGNHIQASAVVYSDSIEAGVAPAPLAAGL